MQKATVCYGVFTDKNLRKMPVNEFIGPLHYFTDKIMSFT